MNWQPKLSNSCRLFIHLEAVHVSVAVSGEREREREVVQIHFLCEFAQRNTWIQWSLFWARKPISIYHHFACCSTFCVLIKLRILKTIKVQCVDLICVINLTSFYFTYINQITLFFNFFFCFVSAALAAVMPHCFASFLAFFRNTFTQNRADQSKNRKERENWKLLKITKWFLTLKELKRVDSLHLVRSVNSFYSTSNNKNIPWHSSHVLAFISNMMMSFGFTKAEDRAEQVNWIWHLPKIPNATSKNNFFDKFFFYFARARSRLYTCQFTKKVQWNDEINANKRNNNNMSEREGRGNY